MGRSSSVFGLVLALAIQSTLFTGSDGNRDLILAVTNKAAHFLRVQVVEGLKNQEIGFPMKISNGHTGYYRISENIIDDPQHTVALTLIDSYKKANKGVILVDSIANKTLPGSSGTIISHFYLESRLVSHSLSYSPQHFNNLQPFCTLLFPRPAVGECPRSNNWGPKSYNPQFQFHVLNFLNRENYLNGINAGFLQANEHTVFDPSEDDVDVVVEFKDWQHYLLQSFHVNQGNQIYFTANLETFREQKLHMMQVRATRIGDLLVEVPLRHKLLQEAHGMDVRLHPLGVSLTLHTANEHIIVPPNPKITSWKIAREDKERLFCIWPWRSDDKNYTVYHCQDEKHANAAFYIIVKNDIPNINLHVRVSGGCELEFQVESGKTVRRQIWLDMRNDFRRDLDVETSKPNFLYRPFQNVSIEQVIASGAQMLWLQFGKNSDIQQQYLEPNGLPIAQYPGGPYTAKESLWVLHEEGGCKHVVSENRLLGW